MSVQTENEKKPLEKLKKTAEHLRFLLLLVARLWRKNEDVWVREREREKRKSGKS